MKLLVTGGAGFIGSAVVLDLIARAGVSVVNVDKLTYAANLRSLDAVAHLPNYAFEQADIGDAAAMVDIFERHTPDAVMHLAAESHVDRSIDGPAAFVQTNIVGTSVLLDCAHRYWSGLDEEKRQGFRFLHISTDEVFGDLDADEPAFTEETRYAPSSPYSASKASSDHLVRAWYRTYGFPVLITNCSNNYGPRHFPEKLVPLMIINAISGKPLPVYGDGSNIRDWLYVEDHCRGIDAVIRRGALGETYNIGGDNEWANLNIAKLICTLLDQRRPEQAPHERLINFVANRPGHDWRYAIDPRKMSEELSWRPEETFNTGIAKTVDWYLERHATDPAWGGMAGE